MSDDDVLDIDAITVNLDHLTVEEIEEVEEATGLSIETLGVEGKPKGKLLRGLAYVIRKRTDPDFTLEKAGKLKVRISEGGVPPTPAAG